MTKKKSTKRALISSLLILAMCFTMLAGTTFAWFTDSVTSTGNKIVAGKLDIQLFLGTDVDTYTTEISDSTNPIFGAANSLVAQNNPQDTLWEPGKTQIAYLKLKNNGNLWLKYSVAIDVKNNVKDLYEMRLMFEPQAAYYACLRASDEELETIFRYGELDEQMILRRDPLWDESE